MGRLGPYSLLLLAAAAALATGWLIPRLPGGWAVALGLFALALVLAILVRELSRAVPGELHLARARLGLKARRAPSIYIRRLFNSYAQRYDRHLFTELDYQVPNLLRDLVDGWVRDGALDVADLGCGTGALGPLFRRLARRLDGVDLSPAMLGHADVRGVYDELVEGDLLAFLLAADGSLRPPPRRRRASVSGRSRAAPGRSPVARCVPAGCSPSRSRSARAGPSSSPGAADSRMTVQAWARSPPLSDSRSSPPGALRCAMRLVFRSAARSFWCRNLLPKRSSILTLHERSCISGLRQWIVAASRRWRYSSPVRSTQGGRIACRS